MNNLLLLRARSVDHLGFIDKRMEKNDIDLPELLINKAKEMPIIEIKTNLKINQP
ncbi:hypothetical protein [Pedobacter sp.]|uniref:hypothetical protein n=1 Tax=Pedobacter sp. TaxID=1411316 RepID=UPI002C72ED85|nr:hypothetical protein [Pedobacter sp.]HWW40970.1 hypothetical protein [Pedobacter sp.]